MAFLRSLTPSVRRLTLGSTVSSLLPLLAGYVRYCPEGNLHFIAYSPKLVKVWHFRKFAAAKESVTGILSLPRMLVGTWSQRRPYEESDRIGDRITGRRRGVAAEVALPFLLRRAATADRGALALLDAHPTM